MFSCSQNSKKPYIQNIINNYGGDGTGSSNLELSNILLLINDLCSNFNILETSFNNFHLDLSGVPYPIFNELSFNFYDLLSDFADLSSTVADISSTVVDLSSNFYDLNLSLDNHFSLDSSNLLIKTDICLNNGSINFYSISSSNEYISLQPPIDISSSYNLILPSSLTSDDSGSILRVDGSGGLYFDKLEGLNVGSTTKTLKNDNYIEKIYTNRDGNDFLNNLNVLDAVALLKKNEGFIINYYEPVNLFNSKRDNTNLYNNTDLYEKISYDNAMIYFNEKNLLGSLDINSKNYAIKNISQNLINTYLNNAYRGTFGSFLNVFANDKYVKLIDKIIYLNSVNNDTVNASDNAADKDIKNYINLFNKNSPNKDLSFNEVSKLGPYGLTPPYYFDLSGTGLQDVSNSIYFNTDVSFNNNKLNLINFGGIEYEQNVSLIKNIMSSSSDNIIFYFYEQANFADMIRLFSDDFSANAAHIKNYVSFKEFVLDSSNILTYDYGNLMFLIDNSSCNIKSNANNLLSGEISSNILQNLNIDNILVPDYSDLSENFISNGDFINHVNINANITGFTGFSNVSMYNISSVIGSDKVTDYNTIKNKNNVVLCPLPTNNYLIDELTGNYIEDSEFNKYVYYYTSLIQTLYKFDSSSGNDISFSFVVSTNETNLANIVCFDPSFNFLVANKNLFLTYYDLPNFTNTEYGQNLFNVLDLDINERMFNNGRMGGNTKVYYPFYFDNSVNILNNIANFVRNNELTKYFYGYNTGNIKNVFMKGYIQIQLVYLIIYLLQKYQNNTIESFSSREVMGFYNDLVNNNIDLNNYSDLSDSLFVVNNLFENDIHISNSGNGSGSGGLNLLFDICYNLMQNNNKLSVSDSVLNDALTDLISYHEFVLGLSSKILKLVKMADLNKKSYYTLYNLNNIQAKSVATAVEENVYNMTTGDISNNSLDDDLRYYLLNNWKQYYPNVNNYLS